MFEATTTGETTLMFMARPTGSLLEVTVEVLAANYRTGSSKAHVRNCML